MPLRLAEAAAEVNLLPPAVNIGVTYRDDRDGSIDPDPGKVRELGLGAKRRHCHIKGERGNSREILHFPPGPSSDKKVFAQEAISFCKIFDPVVARCADSLCTNWSRPRQESHGSQ